MAILCHVILVAAVILSSSAQDYAIPHISGPRDMKVAENLIASFFCKATGNPTPTFEWEINGKRINPHKKRFKDYQIYEMPQGTVLRILSVKQDNDRRGYDPNDDSLITCVAKNSVGQSTANATLHIYPRDGIPQGYPRIIENPQLQNIQKGQKARMICAAEADGMDQPNIYWLKDELPIDTSDERIKVDDKGDGALTIERTKEHDHGKYECVAENSIGVAYSSPAMLYIKVRRVPPHFPNEPPPVVNVDPNSSVAIDCVAVGSPMPVVLWRKGYQDVYPDMEPLHGKSTLNLTNILESANYTCVAQSELGNIEANVQVIVKEEGTTVDPWYDWLNSY